MSLRSLGKLAIGYIRWSALYGMFGWAASLVIASIPSIAPYNNALTYGQGFDYVVIALNILFFAAPLALTLLSYAILPLSATVASISAVMFIWCFILTIVFHIAKRLREMD